VTLNHTLVRKSFRNSSLDDGESSFSLFRWLHCIADEALIVLHYLGYPRLRQSILGGESRETHTISVNHRHGNCVRVDMRLRHGANIDWATVRQNNSVSGAPDAALFNRCDKGTAERQAHDNRRRDRSLMDSRSHGGCQFCSGFRIPSFALIIAPRKARMGFSNA
jgi:hypothetical protein